MVSEYFFYKMQFHRNCYYIYYKKWRNYRGLSSQKKKEEGGRIRAPVSIKYFVTHFYNETTCEACSSQIRFQLLKVSK